MKRGHHPGRELFEQAHPSWHVPVAEMHQRKVLRAEAPFRHDFDKAAVAHEVGLHHRRQVTNAGTGEKRECRAGKVVHRQVWLKCQRFLIPPVEDMLNDKIVKRLGRVEEGGDLVAFVASPLADSKAAPERQLERQPVAELPTPAWGVDVPRPPLPVPVPDLRFGMRM